MNFHGLLFYLAEESAATSEELSGQANMLKTLTGKFILVDEGTGTAAAKAAVKSYADYSDMDLAFRSDIKY